MINLLPLIDLKRDALQGSWEVGPQGVVLASETGFGVLEIPYVPPEEYDYEMEFTPTGGTHNVNQYLSAAGRSFAWKLNGHGRSPPLYGFERFDGLKAFSRMEVAAERDLRLVVETRMTSKIEVRRSGLRALVNNQEFVKWTGDFSRFSMEVETQLRDPRHLGFGSYKRSAIFHRAEVREISDTSAPTPQAIPAVSGRLSPSNEPWQDLLRDPSKLYMWKGAELKPEGALFSGTATLDSNDGAMSDGAVRMLNTYDPSKKAPQLRARVSHQGICARAAVVDGKAVRVEMWNPAENRASLRGERPLLNPLPAGRDYELEVRWIGREFTVSLNGNALGTMPSPSSVGRGRFGVGSADAAPSLIKALQILDLSVATTRSASERQLPTQTGPKPATATKDAPFTNTLGMKFVPVPITGGPTGGQRVLFCVWETQLNHFELFATETKRAWPKPPFQQGPTHPVVRMSWEDAADFCAWLTERERRSKRLGTDEMYRLPSDHEWSCAVGIGEREDARRTPQEKNDKIANVFPWGSEWPPRDSVGNYSGEEVKGRESFCEQKIQTQYHDGFPETAPSGSFAANSFGLYDLGGNALEWCDDLWGSNKIDRTMRGASFGESGRDSLQSSHRYGRGPEYRDDFRFGFRIVLGSNP